jgi:hypothetical protein
MPRFLLAALATSLSLGLAACQQPAQQSAAPTPATSAPARAVAPSVADLVGARAAGGQSEMEARGYSVARMQGLTAYWWHPAGACVRTVTNQGRYEAVGNVPASNCGR